MKERLYQILLVSLSIGVGFSWFTVFNDFVRFHTIYGTVFKIENCLVPNPITTPCFFGAVGFLIALFLVLRKNFQALKYLLLGGTVFAWSNFLFEAYKFYLPSNTAKVGCSGIIVTNIFKTPCFYGAVIYLIALFIFFQFDHYSNKGLKKE